jgi:hypothetical protein
MMDDDLRKTHPRLGAFLKISQFSAIAGVEDYDDAHVTIAPHYVDPSQYPKPIPPTHINMSPGWCNEHYPRGDTGRGEIIQLTLTTLYNVLNREPLPWELEYLTANFGHPQWSVAATLLGLNAIHPDILTYLVAARYHHIPLRCWRQELGDWANAVRRCPRLLAVPMATDTDVMQLRKIFNTTYRSLEEADWQAEATRRTINLPVHFGLRSDGHMSRTSWHQTTTALIDDLTIDVIRDLRSRGYILEPHQWFAERWRWAPGGSSSMRHNLDHLPGSDPRLPPQIRPSKKTVYEELPDDFYDQAIILATPQLVARASTKPEPGGKARAIYAVDDIGQLIPSYGSAGIEVHMNTHGMKARQAPADVVAWQNGPPTACPNQRYLSLDYSDFNTEHELEFMQYIDYSFARAWRLLMPTHSATPHKVRSALWSSAAYGSCWVSRGDDVHRVFAGLFSGERHTARNNTICHAIYSEAAMHYVHYLDSSARFIERNYTGDDEDTTFPDWQTAYLYLAMHTLMGFTLKPTKQMCSAYIHEFLQRMTTPSAFPTRPLFATLAQLASGNWYKEVHIYYDSAVQSVSDNIWEMHTRGLPILWARRLAVEILNATMRAPIPQTDPAAKPRWKQLEWWAYRHGGMDVHPLWAGTPGPRLPIPAITAKPRVTSAARHLATNAWIQGKVDMLSHVPPQLDLLSYQDYCTRESYASIYTHERAAAHTAYARYEWPERVNKPSGLTVPPPPALPIADLPTLMRAFPGNRKHPDTKEVLARMRLDERLLALLGGWEKAVTILRPHTLGRFQNPKDPPILHLGAHHLDPALRSWYANSPIAQYLAVSAATDNRAYDDATKTSLVAQTAMRPTIHYIQAPSAAGKTTYAASAPGVIDTDVIATRLDGRHLMQCAAAAMSSHPYSAPVHGLYNAEILTGKYHAIYSHLPPHYFLPPYLERDYDLIIHIVIPPIDTLVARYQARHYSTAQTYACLTQFNESLQEYPQHRSSYSKKEWHNIYYHDTLPHGLPGTPPPQPPLPYDPRRILRISPMASL